MLNRYNRNDWFDKVYTRGLRRFEIAYPDLNTFILRIKPLLNPTYDEAEVDKFLPTIYAKLERKHRGDFFIYKNLGVIDGNLVDEIIDPLIPLYINLSNIDKISGDLSFTSQTRSVNLVPDNVQDEDNEADTEYNYRTDENITQTFEGRDAYNLLNRKNTLNNNINKVWLKTPTLFMLQSDWKIEGDENE